MDRAFEDVDRLYAEIVQVGESAEAARRLLTDWDPPDTVMLTLLRRALPRKFLELVARSEPWSGRPLLLTAIVTNPRVETALAIRLVGQLPWRALATVAATPWVHGMVKVRAEALLVEMLADLKLGERIALARIAPRTIVARLLGDADAKVVQAALENSHLAPEDLLRALGRDDATRILLEEVAASPRWTNVYAVGLALVLHRRTPLALALSRVTALTPRDLARVAASNSLAPLVCAAAERVLTERQGHAKPRD